MPKKLNPPRLKKKRRAKRVVYLGGSFTKAQKALRVHPDEEKIKAWQAHQRWFRERAEPIIAGVIVLLVLALAFTSAYRATHPAPKGVTSVSHR